MTHVDSICTRRRRLAWLLFCAGNQVNLRVFFPALSSHSPLCICRPCSRFLACPFFVRNSEGNRIYFCNPPSADNASQEARQECLRQIVQMRRTHGAKKDWSAILGEADRSLGVRPAARPLQNLRDLAAPLDFRSQTPDYAAFPQKSEHYVALGSDMSSKSRAWECFCGQMAADALHPEWINRPLCDQLGALLQTCFTRSVAAGCLFVSAPLLLPNCFPARTPLRAYASRRMVGPSHRAIQL